MSKRPWQTSREPQLFYYAVERQGWSSLEIQDYPAGTAVDGLFTLDVIVPEPGDNQFFKIDTEGAAQTPAKRIQPRARRLLGNAFEGISMQPIVALGSQLMAITGALIRPHVYHDVS